MNTIKNILRLVVTGKGTDWGLLLLRVAAGAMMLTHGLQKAAGYSALSQTFPDPIGLGPGLSLALITAAEVAGSLMLILGLFTRLGALMLMIGMAVAAFVVHAPFSLTESELPLLYLVVCTALLLSGAGRYSLDRLIAERIK